MVDIHALAETRLRADGQRYTRNRRTIVEALDRAGGPLSLPQLLHRHRQLAQSSAYRNLAILEAAGVVHRIVTNDGFARFELAQALTEHHHHHRICSTCGSVEDFTLPAALEDSLEKALRRVATKSDFQVASHQLDLIGVCPGCS
ncbi:MAG: Fe2+/Zn2+ uptake regulation protein [Acidimicrobiales bacterium]|nr:Fe2+/Zn2+ uptake regulation protein [Acidimicrobiales bacterium]